jgi:hypothetical protein
MKAKDVHLYRTPNAGYFANDLNPGVNIGQMLLLLEQKHGDVGLLLSGEGHDPIVMKYKGRLYEFDPFHMPHSENVVERIPTDSYWSKLTEEEKITVTPEEISEYVRRLGLLSKSFSYPYAAKRLLADRLKERDKDVGIFFNDESKLAAFILHHFSQPEVFVEKSHLII